LEDTAGLIAAVATMIAAMMTASNLGARITGWGFVIFTIGSICWSLVGLWSGQTHLVATNFFLTIVNLVGILRWLGRQRSYEEGARTATRASRETATPTLIAATGMPGMQVIDLQGEALGEAVDAMIECRTGQISYIVVATGGIAGIDEKLRAVPMEAVDCRADGFVVSETCAEFEQREVLEPGNWPGHEPPHSRAGGKNAARVTSPAKKALDPVATGTQPNYGAGS
jgi:sporulation protein YlmC with PRC-barrel domain